MVNRLLLAPFGLLLFFLVGTVRAEARHGAQHRLRSDDKHHPQHPEASLVKRFHPWLDPHDVHGGDSPPKEGSSPFDFGWGFGLGQGTGKSEAAVTRDDDTEPPTVAETTTTDLDSELAGKPDKPKKKDDKPGNTKKKGDGSADKPTTDDKPTDNKPAPVSNDTLPNPTTSTPSSDCMVTKFEDVAAAVKRCSHLVLDSIAVPPKQTLDLSGAPAKSIIEFRGRTTWGFAEWQGPLMTYGRGGEGGQVIGAEGHTLEFGGEKYYDGGGGVSGKVKPRAFDIHEVTGGGLKGLHLKNTPVGAISINGGKDFTVDSVRIDSSDGDKLGGRNTDAFGTSASTGTRFVNNFAHCQDDCFVILPSEGVIVENNHCVATHGISLTSMDGDVKDTIVRGNLVEGADNGLRIKCTKGSKGSVTGAKFISNTIHDAKQYGIVVQTNYPDRIEKIGASAEAAPASANSVTGITFQDIKGDVSSSAAAVAIVCGPGNCQDWTWSNVSISGGHKFACVGAPHGVPCGGSD